MFGWVELPELRTEVSVINRRFAKFGTMCPAIQHRLRNFPPTDIIDTQAFHREFTTAFSADDFGHTCIARVVQCACICKASSFTECADSPVPYFLCHLTQCLLCFGIHQQHFSVTYQMDIET